MSISTPSAREGRLRKRIGCRESVVGLVGMRKKSNAADVARKDDEVFLEEKNARVCSIRDGESLIVRC